MSNELKVTLGVTYANGNLKDTRAQETFNITQSSALITSGVWSVGTSDETLSAGDVSTLGYFWLRNLDATNYCDIGYTSGTYLVRLKAGEIAMFRLVSGSTIHGKANTGAVNLQYVIYND